MRQTAIVAVLGAVLAGCLGSGGGDGFDEGDGEDVVYPEACQSMACYDDKSTAYATACDEEAELDHTCVVCPPESEYAPGDEYWMECVSDYPGTYRWTNYIDD